ncbi:MAG: bifunctional proline dehydrogenase/L-glutamate gamma-semialdehyde dehydrogenase, partial [Rhodospirillales bacterium]|nr:bifunctional proline dehydrogenase/L-glutamate gamma-semialdehyde dehydrogenase [Rhodospirillales bacterium]
DLVDRLSNVVKDWPAQPRLEHDHLGSIPRVNVSIKVSAFAAHVDPVEHDAVIDRLIGVLTPLLKQAAEKNVLINFDVEQHALKQLNLDLFMRCCEHVDFPAGLAMQAYLRSGDTDARQVIEWSKKTGRQVTVRLVKGAYWDYEVAHAERQGWPVPVWTEKRDTDACFERMAGAFVRAMPRDESEGGVKLALGSHNARSIAHSLAMLERERLPQEAIELQMLTGMADGLKMACVGRGLRVRDYVPVGDMIPGMAYLVRRLIENTSNESWLLQSGSERVSDEDLLASPHRAPGELPAAHTPIRPTKGGVPGVADGKPFKREPLRNFADEAQREAFAAAVQRAKQMLDEPSDDLRADADELLAASREAYTEWRNVAVEDRAAKLLAFADGLRKDRDLYAGKLVHSRGKSWRDADAEVCDAIDCCERIARDGVALVRTEEAAEPRGPMIVQALWEWPLVSSVGLYGAALVMGNTVLWRIDDAEVSILQEPPVYDELGRWVVVSSDDLSQHGGGDSTDEPVRLGLDVSGPRYLVVDATADLDRAIKATGELVARQRAADAESRWLVLVVEPIVEAFRKRLPQSVDIEVVADIRGAIQRCNQSETTRFAAVFSRTPSHVEAMRRSIRARHFFENTIPEPRLLPYWPFTDGNVDPPTTNFLRRFLRTK